MADPTDLTDDAYEPVDGYSVDLDEGLVRLTLSDRYGQGVQYWLRPTDARTVGTALVLRAAQAISPENISPSS